MAKKKERERETDKNENSVQTIKMSTRNIKTHLKLRRNDECAHSMRKKENIR